MRDQASIGKRLKEARKQAGLTQGQIAKIMSMHRPTISEIEAGRRKVSGEEVSSFADEYGVATSWLLEGAADSIRDVDSKIFLAARELSKLKDEDFDKLMKLLRTIRHGAQE